MTKSITIRIILIISLLTSMQASAGMMAAMAAMAVMGVAPQSKFLAKTACADMPGMMAMSDDAESKSSSKSDMSGCDHDACCMLMATIFEFTFISEQSANDFQQTSVKSPSHFISINFRPPVSI